MRIDRMNKKILTVLQRTGRATYKDIADEIGRAHSTVRDRITIMEEENAIKGYATIINKKKLGLECYAIIKCKVPMEKIDEAIQRIRRVENVFQVYYTSGAYNLTFLVAATDYAELKKKMTEKIAPIGITECNIVMITQAIRETGVVSLR